MTSNSVSDPSLDQDLVPQTTFTQSFLQSILSSIDSKDPVVANAWLETLLDVIDLLPVEVIKTVIFPIVVTKAHISEPVPSRLACCKLVGKIAPKFEPYLIKKEVLPIVQSLTQDVDYEVRACMSSQLTYVAQNLDSEATKNAILPELVELCQDEETLVRLAAIESVVNMLCFLDDDVLISIIIPLVQKFSQNALVNKDDTLMVLANQFGRLCDGLAKYLQEQQKFLFLDIYRQIADLGTQFASVSLSLPMPDVVPEVRSDGNYLLCRESCAFNLTHLTSFCGHQHFKTELYPTVCNLVKDTDWTVRYSTAINIADMLEILGPEGVCLRSEVVALLKDSSLDVLHGLLLFLPRILESLAKFGAWNSETWITKLSSALIHCDKTTSQSTKWRLNAQLLQTMSSMSICMPSSHIFSCLTPFLFEKIAVSRPLPCRLAAAQTLLSLLKYIPNVGIQEAICQQIVRDLKEARSFYTRKLFVSLCRMALVTLPETLFKLYLFEPLLELHSDAVPNIRLMICEMLGDLKSLLSLPKDKILLQNLESAVRFLMKSEKDRDVESSLRHAIDQLAEIEVPVGKLCRDSVVDVTNKSLSRNAIKQDESRSNCSNIKRATLLGCNPLTPVSSLSSSRIPKRHSKGLLEACESRLSNLKLNNQTNQFHSVNLDPSTDEFYIDAGIRMAAADNRTTGKSSKGLLTSKISQRSISVQSRESRKSSSGEIPVPRSDGQVLRKSSLSCDRQSRRQVSPVVNRRRSWQNPDSKLSYFDATRTCNSDKHTKSHSGAHLCNKSTKSINLFAESGDNRGKEFLKSKSRSQENLPPKPGVRKSPGRRCSMIEDPCAICNGISKTSINKSNPTSFLEQEKPRHSSSLVTISDNNKFHETKALKCTSVVQKRSTESSFKRNHPNRSSLPVPRPISVPRTKSPNNSVAGLIQNRCNSPAPIRKRHSSYLETNRTRISVSKGTKKELL